MTEAERIVAWAEEQAVGKELPTKRPQGRAGHLRHEDKQAIRLAYLEGGGRITRLALAAQFNVNRDTVAACLQGQEFEELQQQLEQELRKAAFDRLKAECVPAANAWVDSLDVAARKGDYRAREISFFTRKSSSRSRRKKVRDHDSRWRRRRRRQGWHRGVFGYGSLALAKITG